MKVPKWSGAARQKVHSAAGAIRVARRQPSRWTAIIEELVLARQRVDASDLGREADLIPSKWIPYRYMTAFECTELFAKEYVVAFKGAYARHQDYAKAETRVPGFEQLALNAPAEVVGLWKARQKADELGVTYSFFIRVAMESALEARKYRRVPRPNQLCGDWQIKAIKQEWKNQESTLSMFDDDWDPRFFADQFNKEPPQLAAYEALYDRIMARSEDRRALSLSNYIGKAISVSDARHLFTPALVAEAQGVRPRVAASPGARLDIYVPPCVGLRRQTAPAICAMCKSSPICDRVTELTDRDLIKATGSVTPREDAVTRGNRDRKRKQRAAKPLSDLD